jgi:hypothetical protein
MGTGSRDLSTSTMSFHVVGEEPTPRGRCCVRVKNVIENSLRDLIKIENVNLFKI